MENYLMINGKKIVLTKEQVKQLTEEPKKKKSPFERVEKDVYYFMIDDDDSVCCMREKYDEIDDDFYKVANYCTDENLMNQRAMHETLDRLLWRFSCENGELENSWNGQNAHFFIYCDIWSNGLAVDYEYGSRKAQAYFPSKEVACRAIEEIIKPFMKEHPDFVW